MLIMGAIMFLGWASVSATLLVTMGEPALAGVIIGIMAVTELGAFLFIRGSAMRSRACPGCHRALELSGDELMGERLLACADCNTVWVLRD